MGAWFAWFGRRWWEEYRWLLDQTVKYDLVLVGPYVAMGRQLRDSRREWSNELDRD
jgi:hypothetical protein